MTKKSGKNQGMSDNMTPVCFVVDKDTYRQLRIAAINNDTNVSGVMRMAAVAYVRRSGQPMDKNK